MDIKSIKAKINEQIEKQKAKVAEKKAAQLPVIKIGPNKRGIYVLWGIMIISVAFGIYKNFTAIDKETIYEREIVEERMIDTNAIESFVKKFVEVYHAWENNSDAQKERMTALGKYMIDDLVQVNRGTINSDCPTTSEVEDVQIWSLEELEDGEYDVEYSVIQKLIEGNNSTGEDMSGVAVSMEDIESVDEMKKTEASNKKVTLQESFYKTRVHVDASGNMIVVRNPTSSSRNQKSSYDPEQKRSDGSVDTSTMDEIEEFLNTFFSLYPSATEKELTYYAGEGVMDVINEDYVYSGLLNPAYYKEGDKIVAHVYVQYLDQVAKITQVSEYKLILEKADNWKIIKAE